MEIALHALRSGRWYVGIGVGEVDLPLPASPREGSGPAFVAARAAVEQAKSGGRPCAARRRLRRPAQGSRLRPRRRDPPAARACANAEAVLRLIGRLVQDRTAAQWKVVDVLRSVQHGHAGTHGTQKIAAQELGITEQSVSRAVLRSGWQEEWAARPAAEMLLAFAHGLSPATATPAGSRGPGPDTGRPGTGFPPADSTEGDR